MNAPLRKCTVTGDLLDQIPVPGWKEELAAAKKRIAKLERALMDMERWLGNTGHDEHHPWCARIRRALGRKVK